MTVMIRVDASPLIGSGHVMRCLTLARMMRERGADCRFICAENEGNLVGRIRGEGFSVEVIPPTLTLLSRYEAHLIDETAWRSDAESVVGVLRRMGVRPDWLIVDHYSLDARWEAIVRPWVQRVFVIDDLANRPHDCDLLLDQNLFEEMSTPGSGRYDEWVSTACVKRLGLEYLLLRPEFHEAKRGLARQSGASLRRVLISFGSGDFTGETMKSLEALAGEEFSSLEIDIILGPLQVDKEKILSRYSERSRWHFHQSPSSVAALMSRADLALGAGGTTSYERCFLGLPSLMISVADNQRELASRLDRLGVAVHLGWHRDVTTEVIREKVREMIRHPEERSRIQQISLNLFKSSFSYLGHPLLKDLGLAI